MATRGPDQFVKKQHRNHETSPQFCLLNQRDTNQSEAKKHRLAIGSVDVCWLFFFLNRFRSIGLLWFMGIVTVIGNQRLTSNIHIPSDNQIWPAEKCLKQLGVYIYIRG